MSHPWRMEMNEEVLRQREIKFKPGKATQIIIHFIHKIVHIRFWSFLVLIGWKWSWSKKDVTKWYTKTKANASIQINVVQKVLQIKYKLLTSNYPLLALNYRVCLF